MQLSGLLSELPVASRVVRTHRRWQSLQRAAPRVAAAAMQPQQQQQPYSSSPQADDVLPSDHGALVQRWEELLQSSLGVYAERHTQNRKHRLTAHRLEMERIQAALPAHVAAGLTDRLVAVRASGARERKQRLEEARLCGPKVVVDCGFAVEHCRPGLETRSLAKQVRVRTRLAHEHGAVGSAGISAGATGPACERAGGVGHGGQQEQPGAGGPARGGLDGRGGGLWAAHWRRRLGRHHAARAAAARRVPHAAGALRCPAGGGPPRLAREGRAGAATAATAGAGSDGWPAVGAPFPWCEC